MAGPISHTNTLCMDFLEIFNVSVDLRFEIVLFHSLERLRNENEGKTKTQMAQSFNQYSENETKIWHQNILNQFSHLSSSCLGSHFVISLLSAVYFPYFSGC